MAIPAVTARPAISNVTSLSSTWERREVRLPALQSLADSQVQGRGCLQIASPLSLPSQRSASSGGRGTRTSLAGVKSKPGEMNPKPEDAERGVIYAAA